MNGIIAMILAGGRGKRMDIFCQQRPKPILPFAGRYRVIDITLSNCLHSKINNIAVLVDYQREAMGDYLEKWNLSNRETGGVSILEPKKSSYSGTADAVYQNLDYIGSSGFENVLILAGDHIYGMDYRSMLLFHHQVRADITVGLIRVPIEEAYRFGTVSMGSGGRIVEFVEKSTSPASNLASMGIYIFNSHFLRERLQEDAVNSSSVHDFGYSILPGIVNQSRVFGYEFKGYWQDIGTVEAYYEANIQSLAERTEFIYSIPPIQTVNLDLNPAFIDEPENIVNSLISPGCIIEGYVENSILSPGVWVGKNSKVINSIIMANSHIGCYSIIDKCILDEGVGIDNFCHLGFGKSSASLDNGITLVGKDVNLGPQITIGRKSKIMPGLRLMGPELGLETLNNIVSLPA